MHIIKTNKELADTVRGVAKDLPAYKLGIIVDLHTVANIIENLPRADQEMDQPHHGHEDET